MAQPAAFVGCGDVSCLNCGCLAGGVVHIQNEGFLVGCPLPTCAHAQFGHGQKIQMPIVKGKFMPGMGKKQITWSSSLVTKFRDHVATHSQGAFRAVGVSSQMLANHSGVAFCNQPPCDAGIAMFYTIRRYATFFDDMLKWFSAWYVKC